MSIYKLKELIELREQTRLKLKQSQYQRKNCIASDLGPCLRERYYSIVSWDKRPVADLYLQARFERGIEEENKIIRTLMENGFEIVEGQKAFQLKNREGETVISGKIDGKIKFEGKSYPFEVKSLNPMVYANIETVEDFNNYGFFAKYPKQLNCYLFAENIEEGMFIVTDCIGHYKVIPVKLDYEAMEKELSNCEVVMTHVKNKIEPSFIKDYSQCRKCWAFKNVCHPPLDFGEGLQVIVDDELATDLKKREELQEIKKEYDEIDKKIKERLKVTPNLHAICGNYELNVTENTVEYKAQPARTLKQVRVKIERIKEDDKV